MPRRPKPPRSKKRASRSSRSSPLPRRFWLPLIPTLIGVVLLGAALALWAVLFRPPRPAFQADRVFQDIERQVAFGPRIPGSEGHRRTRAFLLDTLQVYADRVGEQRFTYTDVHDSTRIYEGTNIVASFGIDPSMEQRIMLAAHWDTRPVADRDPDATHRKQPVPGANDGASGVAILMEMARLFHDRPPGVGVDLIFFDLEDLGDDVDSTHTGPANPFAIGSARFVEQYSSYRPAYGILLDMVCDRNLRIPKEAHSLTYARSIVEKIWAAADRVGAPAFLDEQGQAVTDDHIPFLRTGIPVVNLVHTPFPDTWHTVNDTPDACSMESLQQVGDVLVEVVFSE